ncbi:enoyl-ACP reductase FabI [Aquabacterium sp.]|uniref:enoyl-ACP reductase FabI n=1 Tax=Aquabacterium sp. TaxID=1872578 RepID=UPI0019BD45EA|nr:enoyl-ACP reductase FabI [Aquabacterium sp.]MBC7701159.1 enoyl-ACP reductase FabI [Aquabacterium sp.]
MDFNLAGKKGLVIGIANEHSIAHGCAKAMRALGAELAVTFLNERAEAFVRPLAEQLGSPLILPCDVEKPGELEAVFDAVRATWGHLDFALHAVASAPKDDLHGRVIDCSAAGFARAMDVSCHSFIRMAKLSEPLMRQGGTLLTISYYGGQKVVEHYNLMGPVKAALEAVVRSLATELGPQGIRVHALSPGPILTRAASGIEHFDDLLAQTARTSPMQRTVTIDEVGAIAAGLVSDWATGMTGNVVFVDGGCHVLG